MDIILDFEFDGESLPVSLTESLRDTAHEIMALLNIQLRDFLTTSLPFQIRRVLGDGNVNVKFTRQVWVQERVNLVTDDLKNTLGEIAGFLADAMNGERFRTALKLYAAHFNERQVRVRFLQLVIAMEALAEPSPKAQVALDLVDQWVDDLKQEQGKYEKTSSDYRVLESLNGQVRLSSKRNQ